MLTTRYTKFDLSFAYIVSGRQLELAVGGLMRPIGRWFEEKSLGKRSQKQFSDERILKRFLIPNAKWL
ncbi:hypothetical protein CR164_10685 [Prosthecochloris marina]|uniref:Uncharacterized protein n=1 Tax=Prosthecochloris marina TaxID=2017681 RepID=A0A317T4F1_9CHLB|nr:hypothetical protein CR164_10685 [Prosthecochloris marina]